MDGPAICTASRSSISSRPLGSPGLNVTPLFDQILVHAQKEQSQGLRWMVIKVENRRSRDVLLSCMPSFRLAV